MSDTTTTPGGRWRPVLVVLALLGLLWMHGLGTHGLVGPAPAEAHAGHAGHAAAVGGTPATAAGTTEEQGEGGGHGAHLVAGGLCLALLLAAVVLLGARRTGLLLRLRTTGRGLLPGLARLAPRARPPDLVALGVCRC